MSIECGECERDLRGGHADDCSRNKMKVGYCQHLIVVTAWPPEYRQCSRKPMQAGRRYCKQHAAMNGERTKK